MFLLLAACAPTLPDPVVERVTPDFAWYGDASDVTVLGQGFVPGLRVDAGGGDPQILDNWNVKLVAGTDVLPLLDVELVHDDQIDASIPADWPVGVYDVVVTSGDGRTGRLEGGFTLTETRADHLDAQSDDTFLVGQLLVVDIHLLDRDEGRVFEDLEVEVEVATESGATVSVGGLVDAVEVDPWHTSGHIGTTGEVKLFVEANAPDLITLTVRPLDPLSPIKGVEHTVVAEPDEVASLYLGLPSDPFEAVAGEPFDVIVELRDANNFLVQESEDVTLRTGCNEDIQEVQILNGTAVVTFTLTRATDALCTSQQVTSESPPGASATFPVLAGPLDRFIVDVGGGAVAGKSVDVSVLPLDAFANSISYAGALTFDDGFQTVPDATCAVGTNDVLACEFTPFHAGTAQLTVDGDGIFGTSATYSVLANPDPVELDVEIGSSTVVAGVPFRVELTAYDAWGNPIATGLFSPFPVTAGGDPVTCENAGAELDGSALLLCTLTRASIGVALTVGAADVEGSSEPLSVANGPLARVELSAPDTVPAGASFIVSVAAFDAYDNAYVVTADPVVQLADSSGSLSPSSVTLDPSGAGLVSAVITVAGTSVIAAVQAGVTFGVSAEIDVVAATADHLLVDVSEPWIWVGEALPVQVEAVDAFGNHVESVTAAGVATSRIAGALPAAFSMVNGFATLTHTWSDVESADVLDAAVLGLQGESGPLLVVAHCDAGGPELQLSFAGSDEPVVCLVAGTANILADFSSSVSGTTPIDTWGLSFDDGTSVLGATATPSLTRFEVGSAAVRALVAQEDGCAAEKEVTAWVGLDDGSVTGPVVMSIDDPELDVSDGLTTVRVTGATDCTGDLAVGAEIQIRTDVGVLSAVTPSGFGLTLLTNASGGGTATLSTIGADTAVDGTALAWVPSGSAGGYVAFSVVGDDQRPVIWTQTPVGFFDGPVASITFVFSEPLAPSSVTDGVVTLEVDGLPESLGDVTLDATGTLLTFVPLLPIPEGSLAAITVTDEVRDVSGLRLDGAFVGDRSAYLAYLGAVSPLDAPTTCSVSSPLSAIIRPDGDAGAGSEADEVTVAVATAVTSSWWVVDVRDPLTGQLLRVDHVIPVGPEDTIVWDGRDQSRRVLPNGLYTLTVAADDGVGGRGTPCVVSVTVDNVGVL